MNETEAPLDSILRRLEEQKKLTVITKYEVKPSRTKDVFECNIYFTTRKNPEHCELRAYFFWNMSGEKYESKNRGKNVYREGTSFHKFITTLIWARIIGERTEIRALKIAEELLEEVNLAGGIISDNLKIVEVRRCDEYTDQALKMDIEFLISYSYRDLFDQIAKTIHTFTVGIQIKSSEKYQLEHREKYPFHPSLVVGNKMSHSSAKERMLKLLKHACKFTIEELYTTFLRDFNLVEKSSFYDIQKTVVGEVDGLHM